MSAMNISERSQRTCSRCGTSLHEDILNGLCENCLLRFSLGIGEPLPLDDDAAGRSLFELLEPSLPAHARVFGDYELIEEIGSGGMGVVWRARQKSLNRYVALKTIRAGQLARSEDLQRFRSEAEAVARLQHPGVVAIHEIGEVDCQHFFAMELVEGQTLAKALAGGPFPAGRAAAVTRDLAKIISYAHSRGVLHRDLKPSNILLDVSNQPHITDFGLAKVTTSSLELTRTDNILGSPAYMAPEQASGGSRHVDARTDIHALGAILYEALTGHPPFQAESALATLRQVLEKDPVSPRLLNPEVPRDLAVICLKCLEKDPEKRYPTAGALAEDVERFLNNEPIAARPVPRAARVARWAQRNPAVATAYSLLLLVLALLLIGSPLAALRINEARKSSIAALYDADMLLAQDALAGKNIKRTLQLLKKHQPKTRSERDLRGWEWRYLWAQTKSDELFTLASNAVPMITAAWAADARTVAAISRPQHSSSSTLTIWDVERRRAVRTLAIPEPVSQLRYLDGEVTTVGNRARDRSLVLWNGRTKRSTVISTGASTLGASALDEQAATVGATGMDWVGVWDVRTGRQLCRISPPGGIIANDRAIAISPNGSQIAYNNFSGTHANSVLTIADVRTGKAVAELIGHTNQIFRLVFSHNGQTLAAGTFDGSLTLWDLATLKPRLRLDAHSSLLSTIAFSSDDALLATGGWDQQIRVWRADSGEPLARLQGHLDRIDAITFSPDASRICSASGDGTLRVWNVVNRAETRSTVINVPFVFSGQFPPTGDGLSTFDGQSKATLWDPTNLAVRATFEAPNDIRQHVAYSSGCAYLAAQLHNEAVGIHRTQPLHRVATMPAATNPVVSLAFSPDSRFLAIARRDPSARAIITVWDWHAETPVSSLNSGVESLARLHFSPDGKVLAAGFVNGTIELWNWRASRRIAALAGHPAGAYRLLFLTNSRLAAMSGAGGPITIWDLTAKEKITELWGQLTNFTDITQSIDGQRLAASGNDGTITVFDLETYQEVLRLRAHRDRIFSLAFLPDGDTLTSLSSETIRAFRAAASGQIDSR